MSIRVIDMESYKRRDHFELFTGQMSPFLTLTVEIDITAWLRRLKERNCPFFLSMQYAVCAAANRIPEFRQRIRGGGIVEYDVCAASYIVNAPDGTYRYANVRTDLPFEEYLEEAIKEQKRAEQESRLEETGDPEQYFYISSTPKISYAALDAPKPFSTFSVPSLYWGKYTREMRPAVKDGKLIEEEVDKLPMTVMVNHALMDGMQIGMFFEYLEEELSKF